MSGTQGNYFGRLLKSKIFFAIIVILFVFSALELLNEVGRRNKIGNEIKKQKEQIERLEQENTDLSDLIQILNTDAYVESEARKKLNLSKSGESLVVIENTNLPTTTDELTISNAERWWNYFLK